jgi:hypothetical protein
MNISVEYIIPIFRAEEQAKREADDLFRSISRRLSDYTVLKPSRNCENLNCNNYILRNVLYVYKCSYMK